MALQKDYDNQPSTTLTPGSKANKDAEHIANMGTLRLNVFR